MAGKGFVVLRPSLAGAPGGMAAGNGGGAVTRAAGGDAACAPTMNNDMACAGQDRARLIGALSARIAAIEDRPLRLDAPPGGGPRFVSLGIAPIDASLGGLAVGALHEIRTATTLDLGSGAGFALALGSLLSGFSGAIFWIAEKQARAEAGEFYGPGLGELGIDPARLIRVLTAGCEETLWAAGEIAASAGAGFCLIELCGNPARAGLAFSRRLALRAREANLPVLLLRQSGGEEAGAAATRWRISPAPSVKHPNEPARFVGAPAWHAALEKSRGGRPGAWTLEWNRDERLFALCRGPSAAIIARRSAAPGGPALSGDQPAQAADRPDRADALGRGLALDRAS